MLGKAFELSDMEIPVKRNSIHRPSLLSRGDSVLMRGEENVVQEADQIEPQNPGTFSMTYDYPILAYRNKESTINEIIVKNTQND